MMEEPYCYAKETIQVIIGLTILFLPLLYIIYTLVGLSATIVIYIILMVTMIVASIG